MDGHKMNENDVIIWGLGDEQHSEIKALKETYNIKAILSDSLDVVVTEIEEIKVLPSSYIEEYRNSSLIIVDYYWKEKVRELYEIYGIKSARIFKWLDRDNIKYKIKEVCGVPLFEGFVPNKNEEADDTFIRDNHIYNKHILFLSYYFPPIGGSPIQRTLKYVKYLSRKGYKITVVTVDCSSREYIDESLLEEVPDNVEIIRFSNEFSENETLSVMDQERIYHLLCGVDSSHKFLEKMYLAQKEQIWYPLPDRLALWAANVYEGIGEVVDISKIDIIYSTVPEWSPHLLGYLFKKKYHIPWVADYRDPWAVSKDYVNYVYPFITPKEYLWQREFEQRIVKAMDAVVVLDENNRDLFLMDKEYEIKQDNIFMIPNGYDEEDFKDIKIRKSKNLKFTLCYNGGLGYSRKPQFVLQAIGDLIKNGKLKQEDICWIFNGPTTNDRYDKEIRQYDEFNITINNGMLSHFESLQIASDSDIMVAYGEYGTIGKYVFTGKFLEYLRIGRPILAFSSMDSPICRILEETGLGRNYLLDDVEGIKDYIMAQYQKWKENDNEEPVFNPAVKKYNREYLADQLADVFKKVRERDEQYNSTIS